MTPIASYRRANTRACGTCDRPVPSLCLRAHWRHRLCNDAGCAAQVVSVEDNRRGCVIRAPASLSHAGLQHAVIISKLRCQTPSAVACANVRLALSHVPLPIECEKRDSAVICLT